jgi:DNA-binding MarR family transcriptional regulator
VKPSTVNGVLDRMEEKGLVRRSVSGSDARRRLITLTDKGAEQQALFQQSFLDVEEASKERSDVCAVPAAAVVAEGEVAFALANAYIEAFGCTCMADIKASIKAYKQRLRTMGR